MIVYLMPYEQVYLSVSLNLDEATEVSDALELLRALRKNKALPPSADKLQQLLTGGIARAAAYQQRKGTT